MEDQALALAVGEIMSQITLAGVAASVLEYLKRAPWFSLLQQHQKRLQFWLGAVVAAAGSLGISSTWDPAAGRLVIEGLSAAALTPAAWNFVQQWILQQGWYQAVVQRSQTKARVVVTRESGPDLEDVRVAVEAAMVAAYRAHRTRQGDEESLSVADPETFRR